MEIATTLYSALMSAMILNDKDKTLLLNRGLTLRTIETLKYRSTGQYLYEIISKLKSKFPPESLFRFGLIDDKEEPAWQFTNEGMIITPFMRKNEDVYHYHMHKYGALNGVKPKVYCDYILDPNVDYVVIVESAFKAAAMWQMGFNALGVNGVSVFAGEHFEHLFKTVCRYQRIYILFDTEIQNDPSNDAYKNDASKMYAHIIWTYIIGKRLEDYTITTAAPITVKACRLPEEWCVNGKVDVDSAVAAGHSADEFKKVIADAVSLDFFKQTIQVPEEHRHYVFKRINNRHIRFVVENNSYYKQVIVGEKINNIRLSNFTLNLVAKIKSDKGILRMVEALSEYHEKSEKFIVESQDLVSTRAFKELCYKQGDYVWMGNDRDLTDLIHDIVDTSKYVEIKMLSNVGRFEEAWFFKNISIYKGVPFLPKAWFNGAPVYEVAGNGYTTDMTNTPCYPEIYTDPVNMTLKELGTHFFSAWGTPGAVSFLFLISTFFLEEIHAEFKCFPFLFVYGESESGKSSLTQYLVEMAGVPSQATSYNLATATTKGIEKMACFYASIPIILEEYRNGEIKIIDKLNWLRSQYDRHSAPRATKENKIANSYMSKCSFIIVGEDQVEDSALQRRCIKIEINRRLRGDDCINSFRRVKEMSGKLSFVLYRILREFTSFRAAFIQNMKRHYAELDFSLDDRIKKHNAILLAANDLCQTNFLPQIHASLSDNQSQVLEGSLLNRFFDYSYELTEHSDILRYAFLDNKNGQMHLYIYIPKMVDCIARHLKSINRIDVMVNKHNVKNYLKGYSFVYDHPEAVYFPSASMTFRNCVSFDLNDKCCFEVVREIGAKAMIKVEGRDFNWKEEYERKDINGAQR